ncbi:MAG: S8 family serine peptidase [Halobacteriota archaeon]
MVYLRAINFDSSQGGPGLLSNLSIAEQPADVKDYYIVQFTGAVKPEWKEHLRQLNCEIYDYIPDNAFVVRMDSETKEIVQDLDFVQWIGIYQPAYKISPELPIDEEAINITVLLFRPEKRDEIASRIEDLNGEIVKSTGDVIILIINTSKIEEIAKINDVEWIEEYIQPQILNDVSRWVIQSYVNESTPIWDHNLTGAGQIVGISDSGLDYDSCFFRDSVRGAPPEDSGLPSTVTPDYNQRKVIVYHDVAEFGDYDDDYPGHGTHCSGSISGDNLATIGGYDTNDGMAYNAKLVFQDLGQDDSPYVYPPADLNDLFQQAYDDGARIHSNSWGSSAFGVYTTDSKQCDEFMWNHKDFLILFANGNDGPDSNTVGSPATAKNVVSVGATENGARAENMAFFSSHGPTDDGRIKPTVCAPGVYIWSADSDGDIASYNCDVVSMSGTSMSTPTTAGAAALIRQYFIEGYYPTGNATPGNSITPSAALIKAMLVSSGEEMNGSHTEGPIPSNGQGWGRILLDNALYFDGDSRRLEIHDSDSVNTGQSKTYNIAIDNQSEPLKITLVWTDYPSTPAAAINLVNDLNLAVMGPGGIYLENDSMETASDNRNVVESVYIETPPAGAYTITVTGYNVPEGPQPFALVITGGLGIGSKGVVYLDKDVYNCSSVVNVTVKDADLNADNTTIEEAEVSIMSFPTEITPENITLTETGVDTATFTGSIRLTTSAPVPDGDLSVSHGDLITVYYLDADDGTGNPVTVHDTATVDCIAPIIIVTTPQNDTTYNSNSVALNYSVNENTDWEAYSLDGLPVAIITGNTTLTNLTDGWHNVTVFASDMAGNTGASDEIWFNITTPDIWIYPEAFEVILPQGNITNRTLTIGNNGSGVLEFEISDKRGIYQYQEYTLQLPGGTESLGNNYANLSLVKNLSTPTQLNIQSIRTSTEPIDVLIAVADYSDVLRSILLEFDDISTVDQFNTEYGTPTLSQLQQYDVVIVWANWPHADPVGLGDVLADYVDSGGKVLLTQPSVTPPWGVEGRIITGGYSPFVYEGGPIWSHAELGWYDPSHPIMEGVSSITDEVQEDVMLTEGAELVALWDNGEPLVATKGSVISINIFLSDSYYWTGDVPTLVHNALIWTAEVGWLTEYPQNGTISPSNQTNITVTFNATDLDIGKYNATIVIASNDPDESRVEVPVQLIVTQLYPPDIWVDPLSFNVTAFQGEVKYENLTIGNNGTGDLLFNATDTVTGQFLFDDMESGVGGWTHGGSYDEWELGIPTYGPPSAHSGSNCWGTDLDSTYEDNCDQWLMSPPIDLSSARNVNLSFYIWYMTEGCCDFGYVEISTDGGITWNKLKTYIGEGANWSYENFDISGYAGSSNVRLRFRLASDGSVTYPGLYIDDVVVSGEGAIDWLSVTPTSGIVLPKNQTNITMKINTTSLDVGEYNATIIITHNDILHGTINIPVNLTVFSAPHDIAVTDITAPDSAEINSTIVINSTISNLGSNDEFNITVDFIVDELTQSNTTIPYLASLASTNVSFTWTAPGTPGIYNLTIYAEPVHDENITWNNQLSTNIPVITIPDIWVSPAEFNLTLEKGKVDNRTLTIGNNGTSVLNASLSISLPTDIDLDNEPEIVVRDCWWGYTYVVNNSNLDTFNGWEWESPYADWYKGFAIADVNGDGIPDLLEGGNNYLRVYDVKNNMVLYDISISCCSYGGTAAGDIDNDGIVEMLVSDYDGYIYVYDGKTGLPDAQGHITYPTAYYGTGLGIGDIDNDGIVEVVRADYDGIDIFNGETRALEREISIYPLYSYPDLVFGDANGNGIAEIYVGGEYGYVYAYEWDGTTATQLWQSSIGYWNWTYTRPCGFADADNDGDFELFIGNSSGYITALNALTGNIEGSAFTGYYSHVSCAVGDVDKDGVLELATGIYDGYIRTYTYDNGLFTLEKTSVTDYGSDLGWATDSIIISGAKDPRVFREVSFIQFNETEVSVLPYNNTYNVTVTFNATELNKGTYNANIIVNSNDPDESMVNIPVNLRVLTPPHIISFSPTDLSPTQYVGNTYTFNVTTDQLMASNSWLVEPEGVTTLGNGTSSLTLTWDHAGVYNITYIGSNENGSVNITWIVTVPSPKPDLMITEKWVCWPDNCTICYKLTNVGYEIAPAGHNTTLYVDGDKKADDYVPVVLERNKNYTGCFNYNWSYTPPEDNITICADHNNTIEESNESNNCAMNMWICGDLDGDHAPTFTDARIVACKALGRCPEYPDWHADVDGDHATTFTDARIVACKALGECSEYTCGCSGV